jgi:hypothetical protein
VIAFRRSPDDRHLFDKSGKWIGWFPRGDDEAVTTSGQYLGTMIGSRLLRRRSQGYPGYPGLRRIRRYRQVMKSWLSID